MTTPETKPATITSAIQAQRECVFTSETPRRAIFDAALKYLSELDDFHVDRVSRTISLGLGFNDIELEYGFDEAGGLHFWGPTDQPPEEVYDIIDDDGTPV